MLGTGNKTDPTDLNSKGRMLGIHDSERYKSNRPTYTISDLTNAAGISSTCSVQGWYYDLTGTGEKILSEPLIFDKVLYFTTYIPGASSSSCTLAGISKLYGLYYLCGNGGAVTITNSSGTVGGIASSPVVSYNPYSKDRTKGYDKYDIYVSMSEEASDGYKSAYSKNYY